MTRENHRFIIHCSRGSILALLPAFFYLANLFRMLGYSSLPYYVAVCSAGIIGLIKGIIRRNTRIQKILLVFIIYIGTLFLSGLLVNNISISNFFVSISLFGITYLMLFYPCGMNFGAIVFYITSAVIAYSLLTRTSTRIFGSSNNYISIVLLLAAFFYYEPIDRNNRQLKIYDLAPAIIMFALSIWVTGRGGILACAILLILLIYLYLKSVGENKHRRRVFVWLGVILVAFAIVASGFDIFDFFFSLGKWESRGTDNSARQMIWSSYFSKMYESPLYILFGAPLEQIPIIAAVGENCHNSFLQLHAYNGLLMLIVYIVLAVKAFIFYFRERKLVTLTMFFVLVLRGMTDKFMFGQYGMPIMFYFVLYPYFCSMLRNQKHKTYYIKEKI